MLVMGGKAIVNKFFMLNLKIDNLILTKQCFVLPITNPIILGSDFLEIHFSVLDIGDCTITLRSTNYMLTTSLTHYSIYN